MNHKALETIREFSMLQPGDSVVVGYSGGADSSALLEFFYKNREILGIKELVAVHINHLLRGQEAQRDEDFVRARCASKGIRCFAIKKDIHMLARQNGESLEACGRRVRYEVFEEIAAQFGAKIATAHTLDDNAETVLFHLARGTGMKGLCGIPPVRGNIIRPLIACTREEIEEYLHQAGLTYCTDSTNLSVEYTRNRIRHKVMPELEDVNCSVRQNIGRMSRILRLEDDFLEQLCIRELKQRKTPEGYDCTNFSALHPAMQARVARRMIAPAVDFCDEKRLHLVLEAMRSGGGKVRLNGDFYAVISHFLLTVEPANRKENPRAEIPLPDLLAETWEGIPRAILLPGEEWENFKKIHKKLLKSSLDYDRIIGNALLRHRCPSDRIRLAGRGVTKTLKKLFAEQKLPLQLRERLFVLSDEQGVIWAEGFGCDERVAITRQTKRVLCFTDTIEESREIQ